METRSFYNEILTEHNLHPEFKHDLPDADIVLDGVNPSCGDEIQLRLKTDGDTIVDGSFVGDGCAISQASTDIMLGMIVGKSKEEALRLGKLLHGYDPGGGLPGGDRQPGGGIRPAGDRPYARPGEMRHAGLADAVRGTAIKPYRAKKLRGRTADSTGADKVKSKPPAQPEVLT